MPGTVQLARETRSGTVLFKSGAVDVDGFSFVFAAGMQFQRAVVDLHVLGRASMPDRCVSAQTVAANTLPNFGGECKREMQ